MGLAVWNSAVGGVSFQSSVPGLLGGLVTLRTFQGSTHRLLSSSFLGLPERVLRKDHKKELLRSLWVVAFGSLERRAEDHGVCPRVTQIASRLVDGKS